VKGCEHYASDMIRVLLLHVRNVAPQTLEVDRTAGVVAWQSMFLGVLSSSVAVQKLDLLVGFRALGASESVEVGRRHIR
jgi:hypothetical protein